MSGMAAGTGSEDVLHALYVKLSSTGIIELLGLQGSPAPEVLAKRVSELRDEVLQMTARVPLADPTRARIVERISEIERIVHDPLERYMLVRAHTMRLDSNDPAVRASLEASFLEQEVPRTVWSMTSGLGEFDARGAPRVTLFAEAELEHGKAIVRTRTENLSRTGLCLCDVPPSWDAEEARFSLHLQGSVLPIAGRIAWRARDRIGIEFTKIDADSAAAIDRAMAVHFSEMKAQAERFLTLAPTDPAAIGAAGVSRYFAASNDAERRAAIDFLDKAAVVHPSAVDVQLAIAKLAVDQAALQKADTAVNKVEAQARNDPRLAQLYQAMAAARTRKRGGGQGGFATQLRVGLGAATATALAVGIAASLLGRGPPPLALPDESLPCEGAALQAPDLLCPVDVNRYGAMTAALREERAAVLLRVFADKGIKRILVKDLSSARELDSFAAE
jgi:hypothetical protein